MLLDCFWNLTCFSLNTFFCSSCVRFLSWMTLQIGSIWNLLKNTCLFWYFTLCLYVCPSVCLMLWFFSIQSFYLQFRFHLFVVLFLWWWRCLALVYYIVLELFFLFKLVANRCIVRSMTLWFVYLLAIFDFFFWLRQV